MKDAVKGEYPVAFFTYDKLPQGDLLFFTKQGMIKKTEWSEYDIIKSAYQAIKLKDGDELVKVEPDLPETTIAFITKDGLCLNALKDDIPRQGRVAGGVKGINLNEGDEIVFLGQIDDSGEFILNAKLFSEMIRKMPSEEILIEVSENFQVTISGGVTTFNIPATSAEEYPALPKKEEENKITISQPVLKDMINQTKFAVAVTDLKPVLKGELFEIENGTLTLVALDGYRLAVRYEPIKYDGSLKFVVPAKTLAEIAALLGDNDEETASVYLSKNHVVFELNGYLVYSRLIEGEFHPYKSAIPTTCTTEVIVDRKELIAALERSLILISDRTPSPARCYFENNSIKINCSTSVGKITDEIKADIAGPVIEIGFKCKYLLDPLKVIKEDKVKLQMSGSLLPMKIVPCEGDAYTYLVLPVRLAKE